jgi:hypothetical protein
LLQDQIQDLKFGEESASQQARGKVRAVAKMIDLLATESALHEGATPQTLPDALKHAPTYAIARDAFLLKLPSGLAFHYQRGKGVTVSRPSQVTDAEVALFFNGSVYGAIAWLNGYVPLHASAIVHDGEVHAFTGHSGAGKSTLIAALGSKGFTHFSDDVLVLDFRNPGQIMCQPGHKQMKLWHDALALTGHERGEQVRGDLDKYFVDPAGEMASEPMPLTHLYFLEESTRSGPKLTPLMGIDRFTHGRAAFYRPHFCAALSENEDLFGILARIGGNVAMAKFNRTKRKEEFSAGIDFIANAISSSK